MPACTPSLSAPASPHSSLAPRTRSHCLTAYRPSTRFAGTQARGGGAGRREELLREAAQQHLVAGNVEHCCELLAELGDWDRALALAPVVGLGLWQRLMRQRVAALAASESQVRRGWDRGGGDRGGGGWGAGDRGGGGWGSGGWGS